MTDSLVHMPEAITVNNGNTNELGEQQWPGHINTEAIVLKMYNKKKITKKQGLRHCVYYWTKKNSLVMWFC